MTETRTDLLYVSPDGDDSHTGRSPSAPLRTIDRAFREAVPGTTILAADGTYPGNVTPASGGSPDGYVTLRAARRHGATIVGGLVIEQPYLEIRDMEITGPDVRFACDVTADHVTIRGNKIHDICRQAVDEDGGSAIEVYSADGEYSEMHNVIIDGNTVFDIGRQPGADELTQGIYVSVKCTDGRITNNLVYGVCDFGIHAYHRPDGWTVLNNTVVGCGRGILIGPNFTVRNNISCHNRSADFEVAGSGATLSHNIEFGPGGGSGISGVTFVDPQLVNPTTTGGGDFTLRPGSPARRSGTVDDAPSVDITRTPRPRGSACDIGAFAMPSTGR